MRTAPTALETYLDSFPIAVWKTELVTFTLMNGAILYYSTCDSDVSWDGHVFSALGPYVKLSGFKSSVGFSVDSITLELLAAPTHQVNSIPFIRAAVQGLLDGAEVKVERMFGEYPGDTTKGAYIKFRGFVSNIKDIGVASCVMEVKPKTEKLNMSMPRNLIQPGCRHVLFDGGCALSKSAFKTSGTVQSGSTVILVNTNLSQASTMPAPAAPTLSIVNPGEVNIPLQKTYFVVVTYVNGLGETIASLESSVEVPENQLPKVTSPASSSGATGWNVYVSEAPGGEIRQNTSVIAIGTDWTMPKTGLLQTGSTPPAMATDGYFAEGYVTFTSGVNSGLSRLVLAYSAGALTIIPALPSAPTAGTTFDIYPGCDKQKSTCSGKFNNLVNFGGFPFVPVPEVGV